LSATGIFAVCFAAIIFRLSFRRCLAFTPSLSLLIRFRRFRFDDISPLRFAETSFSWLIFADASPEIFHAATPLFASPLSFTIFFFHFSMPPPALPLCMPRQRYFTPCRCRCCRSPPRATHAALPAFAQQVIRHVAAPSR
jgi:hypothetical protein